MLRGRVIQAILAAILVAVFATLPLATPAMAQTSAGVKEGLSLLNKYRKDKGAAAVKTNSALTKAASSYAQYQAKHNKDGHTADGKTPVQRMQAAGFKGCHFAENVFAYSASRSLGSNYHKALAQMAHKAWLKSSGHAANMRDKKSKLVGFGFGYAKHGNMHVYKAVQNFGALC